MRSEQKAKLRPSWIRPLRFDYLVVTVSHQFADRTSDFFVRFLSLRIVDQKPFAIRHPTKAFKDASRPTRVSHRSCHERFSEQGSRKWGPNFRADHDRMLSTDSSEWNQSDENSFFYCTEFISQSHFLRINSVWNLLWINGGREGSYQDPAEKSTVLAHLDGCHFVKNKCEVPLSQVGFQFGACRRRPPPRG